MSNCYMSGVIRIMKSYSNDKSICLVKCCYKLNDYSKHYSIEEFKNIESDQLYKDLLDTMKEGSCSGPCTLYKGVSCDRYEEKLDTVNVSLSRGCNLDCIMCHANSLAKDSEYSLYFRTLDKLRGHKIHRLQLTCVGEPFIFKERTLSYLESLTTDDFEEVYIISNGTLINPSDIERLKNCKVKIYFEISCDATDKEVYKFIRHEYKFEKVVETARLLNEAGMLIHIKFLHLPGINDKCKEKVEEFWSQYGIKVRIEQFLTLRCLNASEEEKNGLIDWYKQSPRF